MTQRQELNKKRGDLKKFLARESQEPERRMSSDELDWFDKLIKASQTDLERHQKELDQALGTVKEIELRPFPVASGRGAQLLQPGFIPDCVKLLTNGRFDESKQALADLRGRTSKLEGTSQNKLLKQLVEEVFTSGEVLSRIPEDPGFFADLLTAATVLAADPAIVQELSLPNDFVRTKQEKLGSYKSLVAGRLLIGGWQKALIRAGQKEAPSTVYEDLFNWTIESIDVNDWNRTEDGLAARGFNALWHAKKYGVICDLVRKGVDSSLPCSLGKVNTEREGTWSGYIQPLEHLLGNYIKLVDTGDPPGLTPQEKIVGAGQILQALNEKGTARILTSYGAIKNSGMLREFENSPGTIWGFEDVRLPYVQAARETRHGQQPLRMWEMWEAVDNVLSEVGYTALLTDPSTAIPQAVDKGVEKIKVGWAARPKEYAGRMTDDFIREFRRQCTEYLTFLSRQSPTAKFATAELSGKVINKWMGALACKAGLWWAKEKNVPVYYCLDGIKISDAINYKTFKTKKINTSLADAKAAKYVEVITLAELREIFTNWDDLRGVVKFVEKGEILTGDALKRVDGWITQMRESDGKGPTRLTPDKVLFADAINKLDPKLLSNLDDREIRRVVLKADHVKMAANSAERELLSESLDFSESYVLYSNGILPYGLGHAYRRLVSASTTAERDDAMAMTKGWLELVPEVLRIPIEGALDRHFAPAPRTV